MDFFFFILSGYLFFQYTYKLPLYESKFSEDTQAYVLVCPPTYLSVFYWMWKRNGAALADARIIDNDAP